MPRKTVIEGNKNDVKKPYDCHDVTKKFHTGTHFFCMSYKSEMD